MILPTMSSHGRIKKTIALLVAISFLFSNIAFAETSKTDSFDVKERVQAVTDPSKIVIPRDYGLIKSRYTAGDSKKLVIHIQDAHCNYEAQSNIIKILESLIKNDGLGLISVEGADGFIDTSWFKAFPDADIRKEVADYFMKKGEITGPEFLSITSDYPIKLFGAETREYYLENLKAFTSSYPLKEDTEKYFNQIKAVLNKLKVTIYSNELKEFDAKSQDYETKKIAFTDYIKYLEELSGKYKLNMRQYDNLFKLVSVLVYEKKINFNVVDKERSTLIDAITKKLDKDQLAELVNKSLEFKMGKISSAEYYDYLKALALKYGIALSNDYPNLFNYIIYNSVYSRIENESLFKDIKKFEETLKNALFVDDDQRTLDKLSKDINILLGLANIRLLNDDFDYYKTHREDFEHEIFASFIDKMAAKFGFSFEVDRPSDAVREGMSKLEDFYKIAIKRDKALVDNTMEAMKKEDAQISVLVTGGFHSEGIAKLLEEQGISYIVVCPNITKDVETPYIKILTNQRTPLEDILSDTAAATTDAKNTKGSMLAPQLLTAMRIRGEDLGKLLDAAFAQKYIADWLPQARAEAQRVKLELTPGLAALYFNRAVDNALEEHARENKPTAAELKKKRAEARSVKGLAEDIIKRLIVNTGRPKPDLPGGAMGKFTVDGCVVSELTVELSDDGRALTLKDISGRELAKEEVIGRISDKVIARHLRFIRGALDSPAEPLGDKDREIAEGIYGFLADKAQGKKIVALQVNSGSGREKTLGFADSENMFIGGLFGLETKKTFMAQLPGQSELNGIVSSISDKTAGMMTKIEFLEAVRDRLRKIKGDTLEQFEKLVEELKTWDDLADDPVAVFHEALEGYFSSHAGAREWLSSKKIIPHTYGRGLGYKRRPRAGSVQGELTVSERALVESNKGHGLQDMIFGPKVNGRLSDKISAILEKPRTAVQLDYTAAILTRHQLEALNAVAAGLRLHPAYREYVRQMWAQLLMPQASQDDRPMKGPLSIIRDPSVIGNPSLFNPVENGNFLLDSVAPEEWLQPENEALPPPEIPYSSIRQDTENAAVASQNIKIIVSTMDAGVGENVKRKRYIARRLEIPESEIGHIKISAKAIDMGRYIEWEGRQVFVSIAEGKLLQLAKIGEQRKFSGVSLELLVNERSESAGNIIDGSAESYGLLLDKTICLYDRYKPDEQSRCTYREFLSKHGVTIRDMVYQQDVPPIEEGRRWVAQTKDAPHQPGGHGQLGFYFLYNTYHNTPSASDGKTIIRFFCNGDNFNSRADEHIVGYMARHKMPIINITTEARPIDKKGGKKGWRIIRVGDRLLHVRDMMEEADAKAAAKIAATTIGADGKTVLNEDLYRKYLDNFFYGAGLEGGFGKPNTQKFNTNIYYINESVMHSILRELVASETVTEEQLYDIISPTLISKPSKVGTDNKIYIPIDGAIGVAMQNLNAFIVTHKNDPRIEKILARYGIDRLLYEVPVPRNRVFTPFKKPYDKIFLDRLRVDTENWVLIDGASEDQPTQFELSPPSFDLEYLINKKEVFWDDVANTEDALGAPDIYHLQSLMIRGIALLKDAQLAGNIEIVNDSGKPVNLKELSDIKSDSYKPMAYLKEDGKLVLKGVRIEIDKSGVVKIENAGNTQLNDIQLREAVARRARGIWVERGCGTSTDSQMRLDWVQAEKEVRAMLNLDKAAGPVSPGVGAESVRGVGAIRGKGGDVSAKDHGTRLKGHSIYARNRLKLARQEKSLNGALSRRIKEKRPDGLAANAYDIVKNQVKSPPTDALVSLIGDISPKIRDLQEALRARAQGITFRVVTGLKEELRKAGLADLQDIIFHYGVTRQAIYIDEEDFKYLFNLANDIDIIVEGAIHEKAHIDNELANLEDPGVKLLSESEIEKIAPSVLVRTAILERSTMNVRKDINKADMDIVLDAAVNGDKKAYKAIVEIPKDKLAAYLEGFVADGINKIPEDLFGFGKGYDIRGNAQPVDGGIVDLTPLNVYIVGKLLGTHYAKAGDKALITGDIRNHTPILRYMLALGAASVGVDVEYSPDLLTTGGHNLLSTENNDNYTFMVQVSGSHGVPAKNGLKIKAYLGKNDATGRKILEPLYAEPLEGLYWKDKAGKVRQAELRKPAKAGDVKEKGGLAKVVVDILDKKLPLITKDEIVVIDPRAGAAGAILMDDPVTGEQGLLTKRGFQIIDMDKTGKGELVSEIQRLWRSNKPGARKIAVMLNAKPDGNMGRGIWDPSKPEALKDTQELIKLINANPLAGMPKAVGAVFDGDTDRIAGILEDGRGVPAFEMTLPYYQRFLLNKENQDVMVALAKAGAQPIRVVCDVRANSKLLSLINNVNMQLQEKTGIDDRNILEGSFITTGYPPQLGFMNTRIAELDEFVSSKKGLSGSAEFMKKFERFKATYFTAEASGHNFFHISERYPNRVCDCAIAGFITLLSIRETLTAAEVKNPQGEMLLTNLFENFPVAYSSDEVRVPIPNPVKIETAMKIGAWMKEKYGSQLKPYSEPVQENDYLAQPKDDGYVTVSGFKVQLKDGRSALVRWSNTGEELTTIFEGPNWTGLVSIIEEITERLRQETANGVNISNLDKEIARLRILQKKEAGASAVLDNIDTDAAKAAKTLGVGAGVVSSAITGGVNKTMLLNDFAEAVGIPAKDIIKGAAIVRKGALTLMVEAGIAVLNPAEKSGYDLTSDFFNTKKLEDLKDRLVAASDNPKIVDLSPIRIQRIILNSMDVNKFVTLLSAGKDVASSVEALKKASIFPTLVATWYLANPSALRPDLKVSDLAPLDESAMVSPSSAAFYNDNGVGVRFSLPSNTAVNAQKLAALQGYQDTVINLDMARGGYNYRGIGTRQSVRQFFDEYFAKEWKGKILAFVQGMFPGNEALGAFVTNGIGANDQFMWSLVKMYNANKPANAPVWYHVTTAREFAALYDSGKLEPKNTLFIDISRSGSTWEGAEVAMRSLDLGFNKRIAIANGSTLGDIAKRAARMGGYEPLIIGISPDIGGRNMHRKTSIYYTAQTVAGIFVPAMGPEEFAKLNDKFDKANAFSSPDTSVSVGAGRFLHGAMSLLGVEHIAMITNSESLRLAATEWEQYIMEGSNKEDVISLGIHDIAREPEYVLLNLAKSPAGKKTIGMALLDAASPDYSSELARVNALKETMPLMIFTINSKENELKGGISPNQQAAFDILWTDLVTVFTTLLRVDANSNPNVKVVRQLTKERVAGWEDTEAKYAKSPLTAKPPAELVVSYGNPNAPKLGIEGSQEALTLANAAEKGRDLAAKLARDGMLAGRSRLNLFVGRDDLMPIVNEMRNQAYGSELGAKLGWITQVAVFPIWSHKGLEANLAYSANPEKPLLANRTVNLFFNARTLGPNRIYNQPFSSLGIMGNEYDGINGATIHQTNEAMTLPNIKRMAEVSPTVLLEFNDKTENVEDMLKTFYKAFVDQLGKELIGPSKVFDHTIESIMQSSYTGEDARKTAEVIFAKAQPATVKRHLIFVKSAIPAEQLASTTAINCANYCADYYNELEGYTADIVDSYEDAIKLLTKAENVKWNKTNTIVGLIDRESLDKMTAALKESKMEDKTKLLPMEAFDKDQFIPLKGFFDLMSTLVQINRPLDKPEDRELKDLIRSLLDEIGVRDVDNLIDALSVAAYFEDPVKFAKNFIIRLLPPTKAASPAELRDRYNAAKKVVESL